SIPPGPGAAAHPDRPGRRARRTVADRRPPGERPRRTRRHGGRRPQHQPPGGQLPRGGNLRCADRGPVRPPERDDDQFPHLRRHDADDDGGNGPAAAAPYGEVGPGAVHPTPVAPPASDSDVSPLRPTSIRQRYRPPSPQRNPVAPDSRRPNHDRMDTDSSHTAPPPPLRIRPAGPADAAAIAAV